MAIKVANNQSLTAITALPSGVSGGAMTLLETQTASSSSTISFTSNIDSTYDEYVFRFYYIHPETNVADFTFQADTGTNTSYNQTMTTTMIWAQHKEDGTDAAVEYRGDLDQAQGTAFQTFLHDIGNGNDESGSGYLHLFNPSSTTFVKHFMTEGSTYDQSDYNKHHFVAGYINTTTAITTVQFKMSTGDTDAGVIKLYGIS